MSNLQNTPIVDVNGVVTSRNKRVVQSGKPERPLPKPRTSEGGDARAVNALRSAVRSEMDRAVYALGALESSDEIASVAGRLQALAHGLEMFDEQVERHGNIMEARAAFIEDVKPRVDGSVTGLWDYTREGNGFVLKLVESLSYDNSAISFTASEKPAPWFSDDADDTLNKFEEALNDHAFHYRNLDPVWNKEAESLTEGRRVLRLASVSTMRRAWSKAVNDSSTIREATQSFYKSAEETLRKAYVDNEMSAVEVYENVLRSARAILPAHSR